MNTYTNTLNHKKDVNARTGSRANKGRLGRAARVAGLALALFAAAPASGGLLSSSENVEVTAQVIYEISFPEKKWIIGPWDMCFQPCPSDDAYCCGWIIIIYW